MQCGSCSHDNREGARFCDECGSALAAKCPQCGEGLRPSAHFCDSCGARLDGAASIPAAQPASASVTSTPDPSPAQPASFVNGRYVVKKFLGEGGKKKVYLAHDTVLDRDVAFALIKMEGLDETSRARITREAQAMGRLGRAKERKQLWQGDPQRTHS